jgi:hypothetical protein
MTPEAAIVERCARAACKERGIDPDTVFAINSFTDDMGPQPDVAVPAWRWYVPMALAVLRELAECEPTPAMVDACGYEHLGLKAKAEEAAEDWRAMLRALVEAASRG